MYEITMNFFYESLSLSLKERKKELQKKNRDVFPADEVDNDLVVDEEFVFKQQESRDKRVSRILNNKRSRSHPYLMSKVEVDIFVKTLEYSNSDEMLWGHIAWENMYKMLIKDLKECHTTAELRNLFYENLIDYVPYSELHYYETTKFGKVWGLYEEKEKEDIIDKAIKWCYFDSTETHEKNLKEAFIKGFSGKKLDKFDQKFSAFLDEFLTEFLQQFVPDETSFGRQAFKYQEEVDIHRYELRDMQEYYQGVENKKINLLDEYTTYARKHIERLAMFQKQFRELKVENDNQTDQYQDNTK